MKKLLATLAVMTLPTGMILGSVMVKNLPAVELFPAQVLISSETCWVQDELLADGDCVDYYQGQADAAWEGLSSEDQNYLNSIGASDKEVIAYRDAQAPTCFEDMPCWDCNTMGNKICGPAVLPELPHTL